MSMLPAAQVGAEPVRVGMAFQNPTLLPWLTLLDNVMLPLKIVPPYRQEYRAKRKGEFRDRIEALLAQVGLAGFSNKFPWQLSGGMLQRASLCRALIHEPQLLMLDEPFGALDQFTREELWGVMQDLWMTRKPTVLLVTHDLKEAAFLATRICVMAARPGRIIDDSVVPFPRPRTVEMSYDPNFTVLTQRLRADDHARASRPRRPRHEYAAPAAYRFGGAHHRLFRRVGGAVPRLRCQGHRAAAALADHSTRCLRACRRSGRTRCRRFTRRWSASGSASCSAC